MLLTLACILGILLPLALGVCILAAIEGKTPSLSIYERCSVGFLLGMMLLMYGAFMGNFAFGLPFSLIGFLSVWVVFTLLALSAVHLRGAWLTAKLSAPLPMFPASPVWAKVIVGIALASLIVRIIIGAMVLATTPPYYDDTLNNWDARGKLYFYTQTYTLTLPNEKESTIPSTLAAYPPTVPLAKTFVTDMAGSWSDGLADIIHITWFLAVLVFVGACLRRFTGTTWAVFGAVSLGCLPLFITHGTNAYSDVAMAAHISAALLLLFASLRVTEHTNRLALVRMSIVMTCVMPFMKNEGLLLYFPAITGLTALSVLYFVKTQKLSMKDLLGLLGMFVLCALLLILPWLSFKWLHDMPFGNAKNVSGLQFGWQQNVLLSVFVNTFFEGNWNLLWPLLIFVTAVRWQKAFTTSLVVLSTFVFALWIGQIMVFLFTSLSTEATMQTGYARGLVQIVPITVCLVTLLLAELLDPEKTLR